MSNIPDDEIDRRWGRGARIFPPKRYTFDKPQSLSTSGSRSLVRIPINLHTY